jgi:hypothetical protein
MGLQKCRFCRVYPLQDRFRPYTPYRKRSGYQTSAIPSYEYGKLAFRVVCWAHFRQPAVLKTNLCNGMPKTESVPTLGGRRFWMMPSPMAPFGLPSFSAAPTSNLTVSPAASHALCVASYRLTPAITCSTGVPSQLWLPSRGC